MRRGFFFLIVEALVVKFSRVVLPLAVGCRAVRRWRYRRRSRRARPRDIYLCFPMSV